MQKANVNCNVMKNYFDFLIKQGAVEEKCVGRGKIVYAITERGLHLIKCFKDLNQVIPIMELELKSIQTKQRTNLPE
jgi:predicted transcriptional regulator